ncbi:MAG: response regulator [bacterium]
MIDDPQILEAIKTDSVEHIQKLNNGLIILEKDPTDTQIQQEVMRGFHNIKGLAKVMDFQNIESICHRCEDLMRDVISGQKTFSPVIINSMFKAVDTIEHMLTAAINGGDSSDFDTEAFLHNFGEEPDQPAVRPDKKATAPPLEKPDSREEVFKFEVQDWEKPADNPEDDDEISFFNNSLQDLSGRKSPDKANKKKGKTAKPPSDKKARKKSKSILAAKINKGKAATKPLTRPSPVRKPSSFSKTKSLYESIRIDTKKIDDFINLSGEMIISRLNMKSNQRDIDSFTHKLEQLERKLSVHRKSVVPMLTSVEENLREQESSRIDSLSEDIVSLRKLTDQLSHQFTKNFNRIRALTDEFKDKVMRMRMVPAGNLFDMFMRSMRDLALEFGKEITFRHCGSETEIDKHMIENLQEPIMHLLRNAVDHGIESPEERREANKDIKGTIVMSTYHYGSQVIIEVEDDGRGMDPDFIVERALKKEIINKAEAKTMAEQEVFDLIFHPGFSTREIITEISGRGVGMDIVRKGIEEIQGIISISTKKNQGTKFSIKLPITMSSTGTMLVRLNNQLFAIPCASVNHTMEISQDRINQIERKDAIQVGDHILPLVKMKAIFGWEDEVKLNPQKMSIIILGTGSNRMAFWVDESLREQEIVMKGLGEHLRKVPNISGATILGDGELVFIIDFEELMASAQELTSTGSITYKKAREVDEGTKEKKLILVVDDLSIRQLQKMSLEGAGYRVETAVNGLEAWEKIQEKKYHLVVTDVEMPEMNGLELTRKIKKSKKYKTIPVVIVTSLDNESDKRRGIEVGANAYFTKGGFSKSQCLDTISMLMVS